MGSSVASMLSTVVSPAPLGPNSEDLAVSHVEVHGVDGAHVAEVADQAGGVDEDRPQDVAENVDPDDRETSGSARAGGLDEVEIAHRCRHALGHARDRRGEHDRQGESV